jgi:hypothetical protein
MKIRCEEKDVDGYTWVECDSPIGKFSVSGMPWEYSSNLVYQFLRRIEEQNIAPEEGLFFDDVIPTVNLLLKQTGIKHWQIVWSDSNGCFPWSDMCHEAVRKVQPLRFRFH